jgi:TP901 family phage tail tape measure protein
MANNNELQLPISAASQRDHAKMAKEFAKAREETAQILSNFKSIQDLMKSMKAVGFGQLTTTGRSNAFTGAANRARSQASQLAFEGTSQGGRVIAERNYAKAAREGLRHLQGQMVTSQALNLNTRTRSSTLQKISSLQDALNMKAAVDKRLGIEALANNRSKVTAFQRQSDALSRVIARLKEEKRIRDQIANTNSRNMVLEQAQASRARRATRERLFGDNGATLLTVQAGLMANYAGLSALQSGLKAAFDFTIQLDGAMRNLQAIVGLSDGSMSKLRDTIIDVSEATKFTAVEVAQAAVTLGQAGLSVKEIEDSIKAVTLLATATGTDLPRAVDIATSVLGVFNMESSRMADVADLMTEAVNSSKLNLEKLTLGLQYSGNIAAQSGVQFHELTAALGAMANAGIRSGSTLGTGTRQILIALQKPSEAFKARLAELGLTMDDLSIRSKGLYGVLRTLRDSGFSATDAIESFEVRAASAYNALANNLDQMLDLQSSFQNTTAAVRANETQMRSFENQYARLGSVLGSVASEALAPLVAGLTGFMNITSTVLSTLIDFGPVLGMVTTGLAAMAAGWVAQKVVAVVGTLIGGMTTRLRAYSAASSLGAVQTDVLTGAMIRQTGAARASAMATALVRANMVGVGVTLAILVASLVGTASAWARLNTRLDEARTAFEEAEGEMTSFEDRISSVSSKIQELTDRMEILSSDPAQLAAMIREVKSEFEDMGLVGITTASTVQDLIGVLSDLREELREEYRIRVSIAEADLVPLQRLAAGTTRDARGSLVQMIQGLSNSRVPGNLSSQVLQQSYGQRLGQTDVFDQDEVEELFAQLVQERSSIPRTASPSQAAQRDLLDQIIPVVRAVIDAVREEESLLRQGDALREDRLNSGSESNLYFRGAERILDGNAAMLEQLRQSVAGQGNDSPADDLQAFQTGRGVLDQGLDGAERALSQLIQRGIITNDVFDEAMRSVRDERARIDAMEDVLQALADTERGHDITSESGVLSERISGFGDSLDGQSPQRARQLLNDRLLDVAAQERLRLEEMRLDPNGTMTDDQIVREAAREAQDAVAQLQATYTEHAQGYLESAREAATEAEEILIEAVQSLAAAAQEDLGEATSSAGALTARQEAENQLRRAAERQLALDLRGSTPVEAQNIRAQSDAQLQEDIADLDEAYQEVLDRLDTEATTREMAQNDLRISRIDRQLDALREEASEVESSERLDEIEVQMEQLINRRDFMARANAMAGADLETEDPATILGGVDDQTEGLRTGVSDLMTGLRETMPWLQQVEASLERIAAPEIDVMSIEDAREEYGDLAEAMIAVQEAERDLASAQGRQGLSQLLTDISDVTDEMGLGVEETQYMQDELARIGGMTAFGDQAVALSGLVSWLTTAITNLGVMKGEAVAIAEALLAATGAATTLAGNENPPPGRASGGGGGQSQAERTAEAFNEFFTNLENTASMAEISLEQGLMDESGVLSSMETLVSSATARAEAMRSQIDSLMAVEDRSATQQEMLNELVREYGQLHEFVRDRQSEIIELQIRSGNIQQGLNGLVGQWAAANLDLSQTLMDGVTGTLSNATSALSNFFTELTDGTTTGADAFRNLARSIVQSLQKVLAEMLAVYLMQKLMGWLFPGMSMGGAAGGSSFSFLGAREGGRARQAAAGEKVNGTLNRDSIPYNLMDGEYVLRRSAAQAIGYDELDKINAMGNNTTAGASHHGAANSNKTPTPSRPQNIYLVDDRSKVGNLGPDDILAVVGDDIARGGSTKNLIRAVQTGAV